MTCTISHNACLEAGASRSERRGRRTVSAPGMRCGRRLALLGGVAMGLAPALAFAQDGSGLLEDEAANQSASAATPAVGAVAVAQAAQAAQADAADRMRVEEIVVTAQRRERRLQDTPISVSAFSADMLDNIAAEDLIDLSNRVPTFTFTEKDASAAQVFIRGIGATDDGAAADNSVIVYIDGVPISRASGMNMDLFDLERVEVLRGPQGTLFGRNAVGGAVQLITKKPTEDLEIKLEGRLGNRDRVDARGLLSGALMDGVKGKLTFSSRHRDGILDSTIDELPQEEFLELFPNVSSALAPDIDALDINRTSVRGQLLFDGAETWDLLLTGDFATLNQSGPQRVFQGEAQQFGLGGDNLVPGFRDNFNKEFFEDPGKARIDNWGFSAEFNYDLGGDYIFSSISSFRETDAFINDVISTEDQARAIFTTEVPFGTLIAPASNDHFENVDTWTQELRVTSPSGGLFEWVGGVFFLHEDVRRNETVNLGIVAGDGMGGSDLIIPPGESGDDQDARLNSYAVFGEGTLHAGRFVEALEGLELTFGLRWTLDDRKISRVGTADGIVVAAPFFVQNDVNFDKLTPRGIVSYNVDEDLMFYASASRGYKSGGFQGRGTSAQVVMDPFFPETALTFESGFKSSWFDNRLTLNLAVFKTNFNDLQVVELLVPEDAPPDATAVLLTQNAANAEIKGIEFDYVLRLTENLTISGAFGHLDTEFEEFFPPEGFRPPRGFEGGLEERVGNRLSKAPRFATNHLIRYERELTDISGILSLQGEYIHNGREFHEPENQIDVSTPKYDLVNFTVGYEPTFTDRTYRIEAWVDNAFDEDYLIQCFAQDGGGRCLPGQPRQYGVTMRWEY